MSRGRPSTRRLLLFGVVVALVVAGLVSRLASSSPDGLQRVAGDKGFSHAERAQHGLLGDYSSLTGVAGVLVVLALATGVFWLARRRAGGKGDHDG